MHCHRITSYNVCYTKLLRHFKAEEEAFEQFNFPGKEDHIRIHNTMLKTARGLLEDAQHGKKVLSTELLEFLQDWILEHIMGTDKEYSSFLKSYNFV